MSRCSASSRICRGRGLLDEDSVVIITADHSCPPFPTLMNRMGMNRTRYERIPWIAFSAWKGFIPPEGRLGSQCDTAPTLGPVGRAEARSRLVARPPLRPSFNAECGTNRRRSGLPP